MKRKLYESIISRQSTAYANELAKLLEPYSSIALQFNSRNVLGNQSSDIINSSMLTNLMNMDDGMINLARKRQMK